MIYYPSTETLKKQQHHQSSSYEESQDESKLEDKVKDSTATINGIHYLLHENDLTAEVYRSSCSKGEITVPRKIRMNSVSYRVTKISDKSFHRSSITSLSFEEGSEVTEFGSHIFPPSIMKIQIPQKLELIRVPLVRNAKKLTSIYFKQTESSEINENFTIIDNCLYSKAFTILYLVSRNTRILNLRPETVIVESYAAYYSDIDQIIFPPKSKVRYIGYRALEGSKLRGNIHFPRSIRNIDNFAFSHCPDLKTGTFNGNRIKIENCAFDKNFKLIANNEVSIVIMRNADSEYQKEIFKISRREKRNPEIGDSTNSSQYSTDETLFDEKNEFHHYFPYDNVDDLLKITREQSGQIKIIEEKIQGKAGELQEMLNDIEKGVSRMNKK